MEIRTKTNLNESSEYGGRFSVGTPRVQMVHFSYNIISKMETQGSRIGVVFNGSPLFTGDSGSGESEIRKWIIENDWLECIFTSRPTIFQYRYSTYVWIVTNNKRQN